MHEKDKLKENKGGQEGREGVMRRKWRNEERLEVTNVGTKERKTEGLNMKGWKEGKKIFLAAVQNNVPSEMDEVIIKLSCL